MSERYLYSLDITFSDTTETDSFYEETLSFLEWLSDNFGIEAETPQFFEQRFVVDDIAEDIAEEIELWQEGLPLLEYDMRVVSLKFYTEPFGTFISLLAESYGAIDVELQENIPGEDDLDILVFGDDEYLEDRDSGFSEESYDE